jgi:hypothetical protein
MGTKGLCELQNGRERIGGSSGREERIWTLTVDIVDEDENVVLLLLFMLLLLLLLLLLLFVVRLGWWFLFVEAVCKIMK